MSRQDRNVKKKVIRYSEAFKHRVVSEIENGDLNRNEARIKYGIKGAATINNWIKKLGKNDLLCRVVKISTPMEIEVQKQLKKRIAALEKGLVQTQLQNLSNQAYLILACQELGLDLEQFKKKISKSSNCSKSSESSTK